MTETIENTPSPETHVMASRHNDETGECEPVDIEPAKVRELRAKITAQDHTRASILEEAAKIADDAAIEAMAMKDRKIAKTASGQAVLTGYIFAETEAKAIARKIRLLADTPAPETREIGK